MYESTIPGTGKLRQKFDYSVPISVHLTCSHFLISTFAVLAKGYFTKTDTITRSTLAKTWISNMDALKCNPVARKLHRMEKYHKMNERIPCQSTIETTIVSVPEGDPSCDHASVRGSDSYFIRVSNVGKGTFIRSRERWRRIYAVFSITQFVMAIIYIAPSNFRTHLHPLLHYIVSTWLTDLIAKNELVFLVYDIVLGVCRCVKLIDTKHVWSLWLNILRSRRSFVSFHSSSR